VTNELKIIEAASGWAFKASKEELEAAAA